MCIGELHPSTTHCGIDPLQTGRMVLSLHLSSLLNLVSKTTSKEGAIQVNPVVWDWNLRHECEAMDGSELEMPV